MAIKLPGLKFLAGTDAKSRIFLLVAAIAAISIVTFFIVNYFSSGPSATGPSRVATPPSSLQTIPGGQMSPEFSRAVQEASNQAARQAQITGGSALPTLINVPGQGFGSQDCTIVCPNEEQATVTDEINSLLKQGKISQDDANRLLDMAKNGVPVDEYAAALNELVRQGKLTPEQARALLEKYKKQRANALTNESGALMDNMIRNGQLPLDTANQLLALQKSGVSPAQYADELDRLVREGKLTPAAAAQLLAQYTQQQAREKAKQGAFDLRQMAKGGQITPDVANTLGDLQNRNVPVNEYEAALNRLVSAGKLTPASAAKLLDMYKKQRQLPPPGVMNEALRQRLAALQGNNASLEDYAAELKKAVRAGLLTPEMAAALMRQYQALRNASNAPGVAPTVETNIPGGEDFAKLQRRVQAGETPGALPSLEVEPFREAVTVNQAELDKAQQQRIEQLTSAMSTQAQSLIQAWQPVAMVHKEGTQEKPKTAADGQGGAAGSGASAGTNGGAGGAVAPAKKAMIKAGQIYFAVLDTAVNSDFPDTPVMATIVDGPFKGARMLGKLSLAQGQDRVSLIFNLMDMEGWPQSKTVNAFAIDPDTARTVMASDVDYHYFKRYGSIMASAFLQGFASAITNAGSQTIGINGITTTHPALSNANKIFVGLGQVGTTMGNAIAGYINTPTTVIVNSGVGLGILFMAEVN